MLLSWQAHSGELHGDGDEYLRSTGDRDRDLVADLSVLSMDRVLDLERRVSLRMRDNIL